MNGPRHRVCIALRLPISLQVQSLDPSSDTATEHNCSLPVLSFDVELVVLPQIKQRKSRDSIRVRLTSS